jgi:hypothetical protein
MRLGAGGWAFVGGLVGAAVVVGLAARSTSKLLAVQGAEIKARLESQKNALRAETEAYAAREAARIRQYALTYGEQVGRLAAKQYVFDDLGLFAIQTDIARFKQRLATVPNPFARLGSG